MTSNGFQRKGHAPDIRSLILIKTLKNMMMGVLKFQFIADINS